MSGGFAERDRVLDGIRAAQDAGLDADQDQLRSSSAASTITRCSTWSSTSAAPASSCASSSTWTSAIAITGACDRVVPRASWSSASARAGRCMPVEENYHGEVAERYAFDDGAGEVGFISSVTNPFCGSCTRARLVVRRRVLHLPVRALRRWTCARRCATARRDDELRALIADTWLGAAIATASCARRCKPASSRCARSRCTTSAVDAWLRSLISIPPRARPWSMSATSPSPSARPPQKRACGFPRAVAEALRAQQFNTPKGPVFQTAIIAGTMAAKRTHELIPFCHPLGIESCKLAIDMDGDDAVDPLHGVRASQDRRRDGSADRRERRGADDLRHVQGAVARHRHRRDAAGRKARRQERYRLSLLMTVPALFGLVLAGGASTRMQRGQGCARVSRPAAAALGVRAAVAVLRGDVSFRCGRISATSRRAPAFRRSSIVSRASARSPAFPRRCWSIRRLRGWCSRATCRS